jgi:hypothetical protein
LEESPETAIPLSGIIEGSPSKRDEKRGLLILLDRIGDRKVAIR